MEIFLGPEMATSEASINLRKVIKGLFLREMNPKKWRKINFLSPRHQTIEALCLRLHLDALQIVFFLPLTDAISKTLKGGGGGEMNRMKITSVHYYYWKKVDVSQSWAASIYWIYIPRFALIHEERQSLFNPFNSRPDSQPCRQTPGKISGGWGSSGPPPKPHPLRQQQHQQQTKCSHCTDQQPGYCATTNPLANSEPGYGATTNPLTNNEPGYGATTNPLANNEPGYGATANPLASGEPGYGATNSRTDHGLGNGPSCPLWIAPCRVSSLYCS